MLRNVTEFCPPGTQIKHPGGLSFDPKQVNMIASVEEYGEGYVEISTSLTKLRISFHRNVDGGPADIYGIYRAIVAAANE